MTFRRLREVLDVRETELIGELNQLQVTQEKLKGLAAQRDQIESNTVNQVKELTTPFHPDMLKPNINADTIFSASADITSVCRNLQLFSYNVSAEVATVGKKAVAVLHYSDCTCAVKSFECEVVSDIVGTRAKCSIEKRGQRQYAISYQPRHRQGEAPATHQSRGPTHQGESI